MTSRQSTYYLLVAVVVPFHIWAFVSTLYQMPSWLLSLSLWDILGSAAYVMLFALLESLIVFAGLYILNLILARWFPREQLVAWSTIAAILLAVWLIYFNLNIRNLRVVPITVWVVTLLIAEVVAFIVVQRSPKVEAALLSLVSKLSILAIFYLVIDVLLIIVIIIRNISGALAV